MNPWPVEAEVPEVHLPRPGHADLVGRLEVRLHRRAQRARARERPRDGRARRRRRAVPRRSCARSASRSARHVVADRRRCTRPSRDGRWRSRTSTASTTTRCAASTPRRARAMVGHINVQRKANESIGGVFEVVAFGARARARLARLLGGAPRRPPRPARSARSRPSRASRSATASTLAGAPGLAGPRRDLLRRGARLLPRDEPRRRPRGRHDDGRAARRPRAR